MTFPSGIKTKYPNKKQTAGFKIAKIQNHVLRALGSLGLLPPSNLMAFAMIAESSKKMRAVMIEMMYAEVDSIL